MCVIFIDITKLYVVCLAILFKDIKCHCDNLALHQSSGVLCKKPSHQSLAQVCKDTHVLS